MIVVGVGCGPGMMTEEAIARLREASQVYGSERSIDIARPHIPSRCAVHAIKDFSKLAEVPDDSVLLSTGDPMMAGLGHLGRVVVPGISSMQYAFAKMRLPLNRAVVVDAHGKDEEEARREIVEEAGRGRIVFALTHPGFDLQALAAAIRERGMARRMVLCQDLGYPHESFVGGDEGSPPAATSRLHSLIIMQDG